MIRFLLPVVVAIQGVGLAVLLFLDPELLHSAHPHETSAYAVFASLQGLLLTLLVGVSLRVAFKMHDHAEIGLTFLVQSYLASVVIFEGLYVLIYLLNKDAFLFESAKPTTSGGAGVDGGGSASVWSNIVAAGFPVAMWKFLYFSLTAMTTTGYGDIFPRLMVSRLMVTPQP